MPALPAARQRRPSDQTSTEDFDRVMAVNIRGPFLLCRRALPAMVERSKGVIINIASVAGLVAFPARAAYSITKAALIQLTRSITVDYARHGVRAVSVCPGMIETPLTQWRLDQPRLREEVLARIPQREIGTVDARRRRSEIPSERRRRLLQRRGAGDGRRLSRDLAARVSHNE